MVPVAPDPPRVDLFWAESGYRFDAPDGEYGVLYVGADPHVAFIETFQIAGIHPASPSGSSGAFTVAYTIAARRAW